MLNKVRERNGIYIFSYTKSWKENKTLVRQGGEGKQRKKHKKSQEVNWALNAHILKGWHGEKPTWSKIETFFYYDTKQIQILLVLLFHVSNFKSNQTWLMCVLPNSVGQSGVSLCCNISNYM